MSSPASALSWGDLPVLLAVARSQTMTEAAQRLGVNQTTVSRRLDRLEDSLGAQLVERRREGVSLSEAGLEVLRTAEQMEGLAFELERSLLGSSTRLAGTLKVTVANLIADNCPELFTSFAESFPDIELDILTGYDLLSLSRREADVALRLTPKPAESLFGRKLTRLEYGVYGHRDLVTRVAGLDPQRAPLDAFPWLSWTRSSGARVTLDWMRRELPGATLVARYDSAQAMHAALLAGLGVTTMPCAFGDALPQLVRLRGPLPGFGYDLWALTHEDLSRTARVRAFLRHAGTYFDARQRAFAGEPSPAPRRARKR